MSRRGYDEGNVRVRSSNNSREYDNRMGGGGGGRSRERFDERGIQLSDYYRRRFGSHSPEEYQNLRLTNMDPVLNDDELRRKLEKEFRNYGDMYVKIVHNPNERTGNGRIAYVNFDRIGAAKDARHRAQAKLREHVGRGLTIDPAGVIKDQNGRIMTHDMQAGNASYGISLRTAGDRYFEQREISPPPAAYSEGRGVNTSSGSSRKKSGHRGYSPEPPPSHFKSERRHRSPGLPHADIRTDALIQRYAFPEERQRGPYLNDDDEIDATRTLYIGNIDQNVTDADFKSIFDKYGSIEDIDIKRLTTHAFAFVRFQNMEMAQKAKRQETGLFVKGFKLHIGYGKPIPSRRLWIGGIESESQITYLSQELDRYGVVEGLDFIPRDKHAYALFSVMETAIEVCEEMRTGKLRVPAPGARDGEPVVLKVDFAADPEDFCYQETTKENSSSRKASHGAGPDELVPPPKRKRTARGASESTDGSDGERRTKNSQKRSKNFAIDSAGKKKEVRTRSRASSNDSSNDDGRRDDRQNGGRGGSKKVKGMFKLAAFKPKSPSPPPPPRAISTVEDLLERNRVSWQGCLVLKKSAYPVRFVTIKGSQSVIDSFIRNDRGDPVHLTVCQRLKLDQPKQEDVDKWNASEDHCFLLAVPYNSAGIDEIKVADNIQNRAVKWLVKYFREKDAAGVVNLQNAMQTDEQGVMYAFPKCDFADSLLKASSPQTQSLLTNCSDEVLLIVLIRGSG